MLRPLLATVPEYYISFYNLIQYNHAIVITINILEFIVPVLSMFYEVPSHV
jgi:hypothetical protein